MDAAFGCWDAFATFFRKGDFGFCPDELEARIWAGTAR
jgi:hypothetical protein